MMTPKLGVIESGSRPVYPHRQGLIPPDSNDPQTPDADVEPNAGV
jgi:hypothetical protein